MPAASRRSVGVQVEGLAEASKALRKFDKAAAKTTTKIIREHTKPVAKAARRVRTGSPTQPSNMTRAVGYSVTNRGAGITLNAHKEPRANAMEFGAELHDVYGRTRPQKYMKRRTTEHLRGNAPIATGKGGYVIQPTIARMLPKFVKNVGDDLLHLWVALANKSGVPK